MRIATTRFSIFLLAYGTAGFASQTTATVVSPTANDGVCKFLESQMTSMVDEKIKPEAMSFRGFPFDSPPLEKAIEAERKSLLQKAISDEISFPQDRSAIDAKWKEIEGSLTSIVRDYVAKHYKQFDCRIKSFRSSKSEVSCESKDGLKIEIEWQTVINRFFDGQKTPRGQILREQLMSQTPPIKMEVRVSRRIEFPIGDAKVAATLERQNGINKIASPRVSKAVDEGSSIGMPDVYETSELDEVKDSLLKQYHMLFPENNCAPGPEDPDDDGKKDDGKVTKEPYTNK